VVLVESVAGEGAPCEQLGQLGSVTGTGSRDMRRLAGGLLNAVASKDARHIDMA
jgi:hypothetical protein